MTSLYENIFMDSTCSKNLTYCVCSSSFIAKKAFVNEMVKVMIYAR